MNYEIRLTEEAERDFVALPPHLQSFLESGLFPAQTTQANSFMIFAAVIAALTECTPLLTCPGLAAYVVPTSQPLPPGGKESGRRFRSPAGPASVNVRSFQQSLKAGLLEMMVARQRLGNPLLGHNNKRNAVGQRPRLVGPAGIQIDTLLEKFQTGRDNDDVGIGARAARVR